MQYVSIRLFSISRTKQYFAKIQFISETDAILTYFRPLVFILALCMSFPRKDQQPTPLR